MQHLHELEIDNVESLDFSAAFAINSLYELITKATEHMRKIEPEAEHMVFIRLPIVLGGYPD